MTQKGETDVGRRSVLIYPSGWRRRKGRHIIKPEANPPDLPTSQWLLHFTISAASKLKGQKEDFILIQRRLFIFFKPQPLF